MYVLLLVVGVFQQGDVVALGSICKAYPLFCPLRRINPFVSPLFINLYPLLELGIFLSELRDLVHQFLFSGLMFGPDQLGGTDIVRFHGRHTALECHCLYAVVPAEASLANTFDMDEAVVEMVSGSVDLGCFYLHKVVCPADWISSQFLPSVHISSRVVKAFLLAV